MKQQKKLFDYKEDLKPEWVIPQLKNLGVTYTEMADRLKVNRSTLYRFKKGTHRSPKMQVKIIKMFNNPHHGVSIFYDDNFGSPYIIGFVYPVVYCETDLQRQINFDKIEMRTLIYSKYIKRFTSAMILKHQEIALNLIEKYETEFKNLNRWLLEQVQLMKTQKTRDKTIKLLGIDFTEI